MLIILSPLKQPHWTDTTMDDMWMLWLFLLLIVVGMVRVAMSADTGPPPRQSKAQMKKEKRNNRE